MEVRILGPVEAVADGRSIDLGSPKQRTLLALLAVRPNEVVSVDRLADELWEGNPPDKAPATIQVYISHLRKVLHTSGEQVLLTKAPGYLLRLDEQQIDAGRFRMALAAARDARARDDHAGASAAAAEALAFWRGPALSDVAPDHPEATRLNEMWLAAVDVRIAADLGLGKHEQVLGELEALTARHPLHETFWAHRMVALYRSGRQAEALAVYKEVRERLADELGIDPGPELQRLEQAILRQDPSLEAPAQRSGSRSNLPTPLTAFVGRAAELAQLGEAVRRARLLTIVGLGGAGKSRLALEVARARLEAGEDAWHVPLEQVAPDLVLAAVARAISAGESRTALRDAVVATIAERPAVLLLDGCEQVAAAAAAVAQDLLTACPHLRIVATSRVPLGVAGEALWPVPSMQAPDAIQLFTERARHAGMRADANGPAVERLVDALDRIPLALELAAAHASVLTVEQIAERLSGESPADGPHAAVRAALSWSYERLTASEQVVLRRVALFSGGFELEDAEAVCADDAAARTGILPLIARLAALGLLGTEARDGRMRYGLVDAVREFARERLEEAGEQHALAEAHAAHFERKVRTLPPAQLERDYDNVHAALSWTLERDATRGLAFAVACGPMWSVLGHASEARRWLGRAVSEAALPDTQQAVMAARLLLASMAMEQGELPEARATFEQVLVHARQAGDEQVRCRATLNLGVTLEFLGEAARAEELMREALALGRELGEDIVAMRALNNLGMTARRRGDFAEARRLYDEAAALARRSGDAPTTVSALMNLSNVLRSQGDFAGARARCEEALAIAREARFTRGIAACVGTLGTLALAAGDTGAAEAAFTEALDIFEKAGEKMFVASTLGNLSAVAGVRGDHVTAADHARRYLEIAQEISDARGVAQASLMLGEALVFQGDHASAAEPLARSLEIRRELNDRDLLAESLEAVALWHEARAEYDDASLSLAAADAIRSALGAPRDPIRQRTVADRLEKLPRADAPDPDEQAARALASLARG